MSKILVLDAISLKAKLETKINDLVSERNRNATATIDKGEQAEIPARTVDMITEEIFNVRRDLRDLKEAIRQSNLTTMIPWDGGDINIATALDLVKDIRLDAGLLKSMGMRKKLDRDKGGHFATSTVTTFTIALYEPEAYAGVAEKSERIADKLSTMIQKSNLNTEVEYVAADKYVLV